MSSKSTTSGENFEDLESRPAHFKGFLWLTFSGTAMLSALILPVHIWAELQGYSLNVLSHGIWSQLYFTVLFLAAAYHSFYRVKTIVFDLTLVRTSKVVGWLLALVFLMMLVVVWFFFWIWAF